MNIHRVFRRTLEFSARDRAEGERLRRGARRLWEDALLPGLERACDAVATPQVVRRFRRVEVVLRIRANMSDAEIAASFEALLNEQLRGATHGAAPREPWAALPEAQEISADTLRREWAEYFLATGRLPWSAPVHTVDEWAELLAGEIWARGIAWLQGVLARERHAAARLARQFSASQNSTLMSLAVPECARTIEQILKTDAEPGFARELVVERLWRAWEKFSAVDFTFWLTRLFEAMSRGDWVAVRELLERPDELANGRVVASQIQGRTPDDERPVPAADVERVRAISSDAGQGSLSPEAGEHSRTESKTTARLAVPEVVADEPMVVANAGLVLLGAFLPTLFERCGIVASPEPSRREQAEKAALLLHFAATGQREAAEPELVLAKLLAGWPLDEPALCRDGLSDEDCAAAEELLDSVISHWAALRNTSRDGFRSSFLQRPGLLRRTEQGWLLHVEARGYDVLLASLPWGISVIRTAWMLQPLFVEWAA